MLLNQRKQYIALILLIVGGFEIMQVMTGFNLQKHVKSVTLTITVFMVCGEFEKMLLCYRIAPHKK